MPWNEVFSQYVKFGGAALISFVLGTQAVHYYYKPLYDIEELVKEKMKIIEKEYEELEEKERKEKTGVT